MAVEAYYYVRHCHRLADADAERVPGHEPW
jgi:hypothetical protein